MTRTRIAALVLAAASVAALPATADARLSVPRCHTGGLAALVTQADRGAGQAYAYVVLVNTTPSVCSVYGYPGLELDNRAGKALAHQAIVWRGPRHRVVVQPGASVKALAHWTDIPGGSSACGPTARKLRITPPGETRSLRLSWVGGVACSGRIDVRAFVPGARA